MKKINKDSKVYKTFSIIGDIILYSLFILSFCFLIFTISYKKSGNDGVNLFGHQVMTVLTPSMEKCDKTDVSNYEIKDLKVNSLIAIKNVPTDEKEKQQFYADIKVGDVLTFKYYYSTQTTITHRVINIEEDGDDYIFYLQGDNKNDEGGVATQIIKTAEDDGFNYIVGKVVFANYFLGATVTFLKEPLSLVFIIIIPCVLIILFEVFRIVFFFVDKKKEKVKEDLTNKEKEIEELKKQLLEAGVKTNETKSSLDEGEVYLINTEESSSTSEDQTVSKDKEIETSSNEEIHLENNEESLKKSPVKKKASTKQKETSKKGVENTKKKTTTTKKIVNKSQEKNTAKK